MNKNLDKKINFANNRSLISVNMSSYIINTEQVINNLLITAQNLDKTQPINIKNILNTAVNNCKNIKNILDKAELYKNEVLETELEEYIGNTVKMFTMAKSSFENIKIKLNQINDIINRLRNSVPVIIYSPDSKDFFLIPYGTYNNFILDSDSNEYLFTIKDNSIVTLYRHETFGKYSESKYMLDNMGHPVKLPFIGYLKNKNQYSINKMDTFRSISVYNPKKIVEGFSKPISINRYKWIFIIIIFYFFCK